MAEPPKPEPPTWRVVVPAPRAARVSEVVIPRVMLTTPDAEQAREVAERLRRQGTHAVLLQGRDDMFCPSHPAEPTSGRCADCDEPVCLACALEAGGSARCRACAVKLRARKRWQRIRNLFAVFLFAVFLHQVVGYLQREAAALAPAVGPISVGLFQFVPPELANAPVVRQLNDPTSPYALQTIAAWYDKEHKRYTRLGGDYARVDVRGPWGHAVTPPPMAGPDDAWWDIALLSWRYPRYFHGLARDFGEDPDDFGARVYVVYGDHAGDLASHSRGSKKGRIAVAYVSTQETNPAYALVTIAHELGHVLGADDTFQEGTWLARYPEGFVQPEEPRYPQKYAEIMAVDVPLGPQTEGEARSLDQVRVGYRSAAAMGWITDQQADLFYMPRPPDPAAAKSPRPKEWPPAAEDAVGLEGAEGAEVPEGAPVEGAATEGVPADRAATDSVPAKDSAGETAQGQ